MATLDRTKNHPLLDKEVEIEIGSDNPTVRCESCGATGKTHTMYGFLISMGVAGHPDIPGFSCGASQGENAHNHWTCCNEACFTDVLLTCGREHFHKPVEQVKTKIAEAVANGTYTHLSRMK